MVTLKMDATQAECVLPSVHNLAVSIFIYLRNLFKKKRLAATHVVLVMLSDEKISKKRYALAVRCMAPELFKDQFIRDLMKDLKEEMRKQESCVTGRLVTNLLPFSFFSLTRDPVAQSLDQIRMASSPD